MLCSQHNEMKMLLFYGCTGCAFIRATGCQADFFHFYLTKCSSRNVVRTKVSLTHNFTLKKDIIDVLHPMSKKHGMAHTRGVIHWQNGVLIDLVK